MPRLTPFIALPLLLSTAFAQASVLHLDSPEGSLAYDDTAGVRPLVIAVPGIGDLRQEYRYLTPYLTKAGYRVVTVDVRGHGGSSPKWREYSAHAVGRDLLRLMTHLGQQNAILIGNSFSAGAALWAAHDAPDRVSAAVLIGPVLRDPPGKVPWYIQTAMAVGFASPWRVQFWLSYWDGLFPTRKPADFHTYRESLAHNLREPGRMDALKAMISLSKSDTEIMLHKSAMPSLIVMGTKDADFADPSAESNWIASRTGSKVLLVKDAGHYPQTEMPDQVGPQIVRFLQGDK